MRQSNSELISCVTTVGESSHATSIADKLVAEKLAACVQIDAPITSHYVWQGETHRDQEFRLVIKSTLDAWPNLRSRLAAIHPYDEPQIIMTVIDDASPSYLQWVKDSVSTRT